MSTKVTQGDLLDALQAALKRPTDGQGVTAAELVRATGRGIDLVRSTLQQLAADGCLEVVMLQRADITGRVQRVPAYRIKAAKK